MRSMVCRKNGGRPVLPSVQKVKGRDEFDQSRPWLRLLHLLHLLQEHLLARLLDVQIQLQTDLLHAKYFLGPGLLRAHSRRGYREFPLVLQVQEFANYIFLRTKIKYL